MSKLTIEDINVPSNEEWDLIWSKCDFATYFHSREWFDIWHRHTKGKIKPCPRLIRFSDGKKVIIPLAKQLEFKGLIKTHVSSPCGTFGGLLSIDDLENSHVSLALDHLTTEFSNFYCHFNPYDHLSLKSRIPAVEYDETYAINLTQGFDVAYQRWHNSQRSKVRQAQRAGALVRLADSENDWNQYYEVYKDSLRRWGKKTSVKFRKELFDELHSRQSPNIKLWLAIFDNKIVAGDIVFYSKKHVAGWHSAVLEEYMKIRVVNLLIYESIKDAADKGYIWFDMNPCGGHEGVRAFKKALGTEEISFPIIDIQAPYKRILNKSFMLAKRIGLGG